MLDFIEYDSYIEGDIDVNTSCAMFCKLTKIIDGIKYLRYLKFTIDIESLNLFENNISDYDIYKIISGIKYELEVYNNIKGVNLLSDYVIHDKISCYELLVLLGLVDKEKILYDAIHEYLYGFVNNFDNFDKLFHQIKFNVLDLPYIIYPSFSEYFYKDKSELWFYIRKTLDILKFYESIEFMHNDLHLCNIWIDKINKTPIIYDFNVSYHKSIGNNIYIQEIYSQYNKYVKNLDMMRFFYHIYDIIYENSSHLKKFYDIILRENNEKNIDIFKYLTIDDSSIYKLIRSNIIRDIDEIIEILDNSE